MADSFSIQIEPEVRRRSWSSVELLSEGELRRANEQDDAWFYALARKRPFYREPTDAAIRAHHARIVSPGARRILDLMSSLESHLDPSPGREVIGLGLNADEMDRNPALSSAIVRDINRDPSLPFDDGAFDAVVCSGSIDLSTHPLELTREVARVLRPGGVFVVTFTDRAIQPKCIAAWRNADNEGRIVLATSYFSFSGAFLRPFVEVDELFTPGCVVSGPGASIGDEVLTVVWGYRPPATEMVTVKPTPLQRVPVRSARHCPWCGGEMKVWQPPATPWEIDYGVELLHVCFQDDCPYFTRGAKWCRRNGMRCSTYRHSRNPATGKEGPLPVPTRWALRAGIIDEN